MNAKIRIDTTKAATDIAVSWFMLSEWVVVVVVEKVTEPEENKSIEVEDVDEFWRILAYS